mmetsp:Transcript_40530/g.115057  ORF Transcript_40530/g.115057 Transcript_40530/m.115057 type:complete len:284 (+) Transcript_40530:1207-2058(+)
MSWYATTEGLQMSLRLRSPLVQALVGHNPFVHDLVYSSSSRSCHFQQIRQRINELLGRVHLLLVALAVAVVVDVVLVRVLVRAAAVAVVGFVVALAVGRLHSAFSGAGGPEAPWLRGNRRRRRGGPASSPRGRRGSRTSSSTSGSSSGGSGSGSGARGSTLASPRLRLLRAVPLGGPAGGLDVRDVLTLEHAQAKRSLDVDNQREGSSACIEVLNMGLSTRLQSFPLGPPTWEVADNRTIQWPEFASKMGQCFIALFLVHDALRFKCLSLSIQGFFYICLVFL